MMMMMMRMRMMMMRRSLITWVWPGMRNSMEFQHQLELDIWELFSDAKARASNGMCHCLRGGPGQDQVLCGERLNFGSLANPICVAQRPIPVKFQGSLGK